MNCIFVCIFNESNFVKMFYLLLESIFIYGISDENTELLIYTSTEFMNQIKKSHLYCESKMRFEINDTCDCIDKACKARLDVFYLESIQRYSKILYLDIDVLVKDNLNKVFDICTEDILYVIEEGTITGDRDYWGKTLFGNDAYLYEDKSAFSSGIMLFNQSEKIKGLFDRIRYDAEHLKYGTSFHDQPFIVYNAFKSRMFNNKILKDYAVNVDYNIYSDKAIHHFPGGVGVCDHKIHNMTMFLNLLKDYSIQQYIQITKIYINEYLLPIINKLGIKLVDNLFIEHEDDVFKNKSKNISNVVLNKNVKHVMEIGFNAGFSALLMLITNPFVKLTCFDLGEHEYTEPCFKKIKQMFGDRIQWIDSLKDVSGNFDLIHIRGTKSIDDKKSIENLQRLSKPGTILIMDDYDFPDIHELWDKYSLEYNLKPLDIHVYYSSYHDVKCV